MKSLKRMTACSILTALLLGSTTVTAESVIQEQYNEELTARTWEGIPIKHMDQHWAKRLFQWE